MANLTKKECDSLSLSDMVRECRERDLDPKGDRFQLAARLIGKPEPKPEPEPGTE